MSNLISGSLQKGLVLDMPLRQRYTKSSTILTDLTPYSKNGTKYGAIIGNIGTYFDGIDDYILTQLVKVNTTAGAKNTVSFWMKWGGSYDPDWNFPFAFTQYVVAMGNSVAGIGFNSYNGDILYTSNAGMADNWVHVVAIFYNGVPSTANNELYINGIKQSLTQNGTPLSRNVTSTIQIGGQATSFNFDGFLDEIRVYNRKLSAIEIEKLYRMQKWEHP